MKVRFWGVRGSIPSPGPHTMRYGGNTTCIEVRSDDDSLIILDAGTGIFPLGQELLKRLPVRANVFMTHTHWDHIQGLPFFTPLYIPGNSVRIHGGYDVVSGRGIDQIVDVQLQYSYFPVREAEMRGRIEYATLSIGTPVTVGDATVTPLLLNHPVVNFGYRIDSRPLPLPRVSEFGEAEARDGFGGDFFAVFDAFGAREELLHQALLVVAQRRQPLSTRRDDFIERR